MNRSQEYTSAAPNDKEEYELLQNENAMLNEKYTQLAHKKESLKQQLLQAETMGMMTKYQLVFVKMETAFAKIFNRNKLRDLKTMHDAFSRFRKNTLSARININ